MAARAHTGIVGVGYEGLTLSEFVAELMADGAGILVDARLVPRCSRRGFSRHALADTLRSRRIHYVHFEALGNPEQNQAGFRAGGEAAAGAAARYRGRLAVPAAAAILDDIVAVARRRRVAIMTLESDPERSHRATLLAELARRGQAPAEDIDSLLAELDVDEDTPARRSRSRRTAPRGTDAALRPGVEDKIDAVLAEFGR